VYALELVVTAIFSIIGFYASRYSVGQLIINGIDPRVAVLGSGYIFLHNLRVDTLAVLPVLGLIALIVSMALTGFTVGINVAHMFGSPLMLVPAWVVAFLFPHGVIELLAYAFSAVGSIELTSRHFKALSDVPPRSFLTCLRRYVVFCGCSISHLRHFGGFGDLRNSPEAPW
jgi:uncharacterized membrane protein SpoIIM required for sporulation